MVQNKIMSVKKYFRKLNYNVLNLLSCVLSNTIDHTGQFFYMATKLLKYIATVCNKMHRQVKNHC